jgi:chemotaxis protein methyltransferase CheR
MQARYFMRSRNPREQSVRIVPELRRNVAFERLNLMDEAYPFDHDIDVIFCRNVLIYFDKPTQDAVIARLVSHLRPGGYLMLGHSESMSGAQFPGVEAVSTTTYRTALACKPGRREAA